MIDPNGENHDNRYEDVTLNTNGFPPCEECDGDLSSDEEQERGWCDHCESAALLDAGAFRL